MADKIKDAEDRILESLFAAPAIEDAGFSDGIVRRIRRGIWIRRLTLPIAMLVGGAIAIEPLMQLMRAASNLLSVVPQDLVAVPAAWIPQLPLILFGGTLLVIAMLTASMLEE